MYLKPISEIRTPADVCMYVDDLLIECNLDGVYTDLIHKHYSQQHRYYHNFEHVENLVFRINEKYGTDYQS